MEFATPQPPFTLRFASVSHLKSRELERSVIPMHDAVNYLKSHLAP